MVITSTSNTKIKRLLTLRKKGKARDEEQLFLIEGIRMFRELPGELVKEVYVSESFYNKEKELIRDIARSADVEPQLLSDHVFAYASDTKTPQGVLCMVKRNQMTLEQVLFGECPHILLLENLQDPGNLGTIIRTAEGAGVTGIVMSGDCVDIYNPKTIRSTMGSIYRMPFCYVEDLVTVIRKMKTMDIRTYAAHLDAIYSYEEANYSTPCAFLIGNEGNGLRQEVVKQADTLVKIPMHGKVESLNAAIAASILMFEVSRQRRG